VFQITGVLGTDGLGNIGTRIRLVGKGGQRCQGSYREIEEFG
jgi:hypothetical protein